MYVKNIAEIITERVASYYPNLVTYAVYKHFVYCSDSKPYLYGQYSSELGPSQETIIYFTVTCSDQPQPELESEEELGKLKPKLVNLYSPASKYRPGEGFPTGVKLRGYGNDNSEYTVMSYNMPLTYNRDHYIFLPYDFDPIAKFVYAFSV